ncbi:MAG: RNA polymerase II mediator complex subunit [Heterodermia speciosa]|uniref:Mediator of RNA polymerase II transcription subunit 21 n=1 Tax=Heterodermia speciosa TaxID=116794 RepID=A0A8H3G0T2_9LECA|nr:MAG: RNA polymerase II mediator complex subunit [Heterodermia speciosa]
MADVLTQLQDCLEQNAPPLASSNVSPSQPQNNTTNEPRSSSTLFAASQQELAQDLIKKTQQIEALIDILPGLGRSQEVQEARIAALEEELKTVEVERKIAVGEREAAIEVLERVIGGIRR